MRLKFPLTGLTILWIILFVPLWANSQNTQQNQLTKAILLFDKENYAEAEPIFKLFIDERPDDFMINYFYGACRTNNGHYSNRELSYLEKASKEVHPLDIEYYLGVQHHAKNNFAKAIEYYTKYSETASTAEQDKVKLTDKILQCKNEINPFHAETEIENLSVQKDSVPELVETEEEKIVEPQAKQKNQEPERTIPENREEEVVNDETNLSVISETDSLLPVQNTEIDVNTTAVIPENSVDPLIDEADKEQIEFTVSSQFTYYLLSHFRTEEGKDYFKQGNLKLKELEKTLLRTEYLRDRYTESKSRTERDSIGQIILEIENQTYDLKNDANNLLLQAKNSENAYWQNADNEEINQFVLELNKVSSENNQKQFVNTETKKDSAQVIIPTILIMEKSTDENTLKPANSDLIYKIQIGAFSRGIPNYLKPLYKKIELIRKVDTYIDEKGVTVYTTGNLLKLEDALLMQKQVRQEGVEDAYIVPYLQGKRITLKQAKEIEGIK